MSDDQRSATQRAQDAKDAAAQQGEQLKQVAAEETKNVASEATEQARNVVDEAKSQLQEQSRTQRDQLVSTLRGFAEDLDKMSSQAPSGLATDVTRQVARKARDLSGRLSGREPGELLEDLRSYARRNPGKFLLGALAAGLVSGRLARGAKEGMSGSSQSSGLPSGSTTPLEPSGTTGSAVRPPDVAGVQGAMPPGAEPVPGHTRAMPSPATGTPPRGGEPL
jgi:hypothetical protein